MLNHKGMTKEARMQEFERFIEQHARTETIRELARSVYSQAYDQGFADGVVTGQAQQAKIQDMVMHELFRSI